MTIVMTILADDNARNRRRAKRAAAREAAMTVTGCKNRVEQALRAPTWREPKETAFVTLECQEYRKVRNPDGQQVNTRQIQRGKSIPLI